MTTFIVITVVLIAVVLGIRSMQRDQSKRNQPKGMATGLFASMDEIFHPNAHEAHLVIEEQREGVLPKPSPEDKEK